MSAQPENEYAGVPEDTIIWHLHWCFIEKQMSFKEARRYFTQKLGLRFWTINPYQNKDLRIVSVWAEGEKITLEFFIDDLPSLKKCKCIHMGMP